MSATITLENHDLAPTRAEEKTWSRWNIASLWVGMCVCVPTYMLAGSLVQQGMVWWQAMFTIALGNVIVLLPMILNGHAGTRYGIPFPVFARASFGIHGSHVPSLARALVACGWFGIQTYIGGEAISTLIGLVVPSWHLLGGGVSWFGMTAPSWISFGLFWLINVYFVYKGTDSIKWLENYAAPFLLIAGLSLFYWAMSKAGGLSVVLQKSESLVSQNSLSGWAWVQGIFLPSLTAMVGFWATLSLNIPDFTRYCKNQQDQVWGQFLGLPTTMVLFSFIGVTVTSATVILYGEAIWNPVELVRRLASDAQSPLVALVSMAVLAIATLSTNIAANVVSPANSFSNAFPRKISFRRGGMIAAFLGVALCPWLLLNVYIEWLVSYSGLLGAVSGILVADYWLLRRTELKLEDLYRKDGAYYYQGGFHRPAFIALAAGIATVLVGHFVPSLGFLFQGAWFSAFIASFAVYMTLLKGRAFE